MAISMTKADGDRSLVTTVISRRTHLARLGVRLIGILLFYVIVITYFGATIENFFSSTNVIGILTLSVPLAIAAVGQTFVIVGGGFDMSVGGLAALGAVIYGILLNASGPLAATVGVILVGLLGGAVNGAIVTKFKVNPLITTLAMLSVTSGSAFVITGGLTQPVNDPSSVVWSKTLAGIPYSVIGLLFIAIVAIAVLRYSSFGRRVYAVGGNRDAADLAGIRSNGVTVVTYMISGLCAGLAGMFLTSQLLAISPTVGGSLTLNSIASVVLGGAALSGGVGGVGGTLVGVLLLGTIDTGLSLLQVQSYFQTIIMGVVLLLAVLFGRLRDSLQRRL